MWSKPETLAISCSRLGTTVYDWILPIVYTRHKAYRSIFASYRANIFLRYHHYRLVCHVFFLTADCPGDVFHELTKEKVLCGINFTPDNTSHTNSLRDNVIRTSDSPKSLYPSFWYLVVLGISTNSKSATLGIFPAFTLYQHSEDGSTASLFQIRQDLLSITTNNPQYAELSVSTLRQCSGRNSSKLHRISIFNTRDVTSLFLTSLICIFGVPARQNFNSECLPPLSNFTL